VNVHRNDNPFQVHGKEKVMSKELNDKLGTTDVVWNLDDLYESPEDKLIDDDIDLCTQEAELLRHDFSTHLAELEPPVFARTVKRFERIAENLGRLATYSFLNFSTQVNNEEAGAFLQRTREIASQINKEVVFFELEWSKMDEAAATTFLEAEETSHHHHYLEKIRHQAAHLLSRIEETLLIEFEPVGVSSWTNLFTKVMGHLKFGEHDRSQEEVLSDLYSSNREIRFQASKDLTEGLKTQLHVLTHIFNTVLANKMIEDRLRSYPSWVSSRNLENELNAETVDALVEATVSRYDIVHHYYRLKREMLGLDELKDYDRYAPLPDLPDQLIPWQKCRDIVLESFDEFSPEMAEIGALFFDNNWIHAPLMDGKRGGAFAHPAIPDAHPYLLVNYTGNLRDVATVAHELGHGIHQYLARQTGYFNSDTPLVLAETASVFGELLVFHRQLDLLSSETQKKGFICQKLESIFATVFRQIAMNRFEEMIHTCRRNEGELASTRISQLWIQTQQPMFDDSVTLGEDYSIWWAYIGHFLHAPGYVYAYAFGELLVLALYNLYRMEGKSFVPKYTKLLSKGGSLSLYELLEPFGIDLNDTQFWHGGLDVVAGMLKEIE